VQAGCFTWERHLNNVVSFTGLLQLVGNRLGMHDVPCPICGPQRHAASNRTRKVLRVWFTEPSFMTYQCARCNAHGYARALGGPLPDPVELAMAKSKAQQFAATNAAVKRDKARWLWAQRRDPARTPVERYLREVRCFGGTLPPTIGFLPARDEFCPAMISVFGIPIEADGIVSVPSSAIQGVHLTRLASDGLAKAGTDSDKVMIGAPRGWPIVLAMPGDLAGISITEGIEDGLSVNEATGLGVWAAGSASMMPALAKVVPNWIECATILVDDDSDGCRNADDLRRGLEARGIEVRLIIPALRGGAG
jgi:hypothetical protein